jgi:hypothetical protein
MLSYLGFGLGAIALGGMALYIVIPPDYMETFLERARLFMLEHTKLPIFEEEKYE